MTTTYQVTAECAYVTQETIYGRARSLVYKGALITGDAPELEHLIDSGMVVKVGSDTSVGLNAEGGLGPAETPAVGTAEDKDRAEARAKLPADGSAPHANAGKPVWVEYAVKNGISREEAEKSDKADLIATLK